MNIQEQLLRDEGSVPYAYQDSRGFWTIGVGFLVDKAAGGGLLPEEINFILQNRIRLNEQELDGVLPWSRGLDEVRRAVLINMCYNMGPQHLLTFHHFLDFLRRGDYIAASSEMLNSQWAKQVGPRATRLSKQIATGEWQ